MSEVLKVSRQLIYYEPKKKKEPVELENQIISVFEESRNIYGSRKIKIKLEKAGLLVSLRKIRGIMKKYDLESVYTKRRYKNKATGVNNSEIPNLIERQFNNRKPMEVLISDLTYVRVLSRWCYVCLIIDISNREISGYSCGEHKDAELVERALFSIKSDMDEVDIFHTDRGREFDNCLIDEVLERHKIRRSLSRKGNPYDNAVAEATYRIFKTEFCRKRSFESLEVLEIELFDYINWYNNVRIHGALNYLTPVEYKALYFKTV